MNHWQIYNGLEDLLKHIETDIENNWIYINKTEYESNPFTAKYYYVEDPATVECDESYIYIDENGMELWAGLKDFGLVEFLEVADIQGVIDFAANYKPELTLEDKFQSIKYYYENDAFLQA